MNNEETILDSQYNNTEPKKNETTSVEQPKTEKKKNVGRGEKAAYAVGGAVVGAGMTMAGQAVAATPSEKEEQSGETDEVAATVTPNSEETGSNSTPEAASQQTADATPHAAPEPEDVIVATATGIRVAQVDDNVSFSQAFADARAQVGAGGVFEWNGRVYSTYYKDEWDNMTAEEKHEYQNSIDYKDVVSDDSIAQHSSSHHTNNVHHTSYQETEPTNSAQGVSSEEVDVQVLEIGTTDLNGDGIPENVAVLEVGGTEILIVDIDQDGIADIALCDVDGDGQPEYRDLSGENMAMPEHSAGDAYMAQAENAPDYTNDANVEMFA